MKTEMKASEVLRRAGDALRTNGWQQYGQGQSGGPMCAVGAVCEAAGGAVGYGKFLQPLRDVVTEGSPLVDVWNDDPDRTVEDVLIALDAAYVLALQEEGVEPGDFL